MENKQKTTTENGVNVATYIQDRDAGMAVLLKGVAGNYIYQRAVYKVALVDGTPTLVADTPATINVNRQSLIDFSTMLDQQADQIANLRAQVAAMETDMNLLDVTY